MSSDAAAPRNTANGQRGRRGKGRGGKGAPRDNNPRSPVVAPVEATEPVAPAPAADAAADDDAPVCWICAEPIKYHAVSECNHRTCHVCALRLRALYKKFDCTFCKTPQPSMIFTVSPDAPFASFTPEEIPYKDVKLSIFFETQEMMEETLLLLRFNCPDPECDYIASGWSDLKLHARATHGKLMCDLCIRFKKVFTHEHALYALNALPLHLPSIPHRAYKSAPKEQIEGGVHPLCEFCRECFFGDDELFAHMREKHEECFICKRNNVRDQYFQNWDSLERHFNGAHYPCMQPQCLAQKFVVFNTALDLKAHMVEEHGGDMTSRDKKDARRIQADFEFEEVGVGGRRGRRDRGDRERDREPPPHQPTPAPAGPSRPPTGNGGNRRREAFSGNLTVEGAAPARPSPPSPPPEDADPALLERHHAFTVRLQTLAPNPASAVPAVRAAVQGYRASESSARDLISTIWNVLDRKLEHTASVVNAFVDLLDEEDKKQDLLSSWRGFELEQRRQFPDLVPTAVGGGYANITSGRVLNAKHVTATRSSQQSSRQVWDRVARAASSSTAPPPPAARFPPLVAPAAPTPGPVPVAAPTPAFRQPARSTPWASASAAGRSAPNSAPPSRPSSSAPRAPPKISAAQFPELPAAGAPRARAAVRGNVSLRNILGTGPPPPSVWQAGNGEAGEANGEDGEAGGDGVETAPAPGSGKGKKGKGKQKQTLFTLGAFPT